jgi:zinc metalloprotease ZmpB
VEREGLAIRSPVSTHGRVELDPRSGALRSWFDPVARPLVAGPFAPRELAREVLRQSAGLLAWPPTLSDLVDGSVLGVGGGRSVRFSQEFKSVPVLVSEVVVNLHGDSRVHSLYNQYHYDIPPDLDPAAKVPPLAARALVARLSNAFPEREIGPPQLVIFRYEPVDRPMPFRPRRTNRARLRFIRAVDAQLARARRRGQAPERGRHYLAWQVTLRTKRPLSAWLLLVDAALGSLLEVRDLLSYATGHGKIFDPNPIVSSGDLTLSSSTPARKLNALRSAVALERLDPADAQGRLHLDGAWVHMEDAVAPQFPEPTSKSGTFIFSATSRKFLDVMAYYHIDALQQCIQTDLGLTGVAEYSIVVDPQGENGADLSQGSGGGITFGEGGVPDATDAMVIVHEYGHALQDSLNPNSNFNDYASGETEGFSDFLAAVYFDDKHKPVTPPTRGTMFSWNCNPIDFPGLARRYDLRAPYSAVEWSQGSGYALAPLWSSATFELYRKLGGDAADSAVKRAARDLSIRLHLMAHANIPGAGATVTQAAQQFEAADTGLAPWRYANGLHLKVIYDTFLRRQVPGYTVKPVDVYVDDGRAGGYGAADGDDDNFQNTLWRDNFVDTKDIWVRRSPYGAGAVPNPADHQAPLSDQPAHVYVQVKNRGAAGSGQITVRVFRAAAGSPRLWPSDWTEIPSPTVQPPDVPGGGAVTAGPFTWTPAAGDEISLLAIVECAQDPAVTQNLAAAPGVPFADLVPFDNNIAMRDLSAVPS